MKRNGRKSLAGALARAKNESGFTLVELIVVIAILGILAGVGTVGYSGYIKKAQAAADEVLLDSLNTAFASACAINGENHYGRNDSPSIAITNGEVGVDALTTGNDKIDDSFSTFFEGGTFKQISTLVYDTALGGFKDPATAEELTISYGGGTITISGNTVQAVRRSTFGTKMGATGLLSEVSGLTNMIGAGGSKLANDLLADTGAGGYMQKYAAYLGVENASSLTGNELIAAVETKLVAAFEANNIEVTADNAESLVSSAMVNGMVFYAAEGMKDYTVESATTLLNSDNIYSKLSTDPATRMAQASLVYGMYAGFVNSDYNEGNAESSTGDPMAAIQAISGTGTHSENFQKYLDSEQGKADIEAYMAAMEVINESSGNDATASVMVNGFGDDELASLLAQVLGKA